jgi:hypothetical protein
MMVFLGLAGCAMWKPTPESTRGPASLRALASPGGMDLHEQKICESTECRQLIAPCSLKDHSELYRAPGSEVPPPEHYLSLKDEAYLKTIEEIPQHGFCQLPPRRLPTDNYNNDTCLYVFVKQDSCPTP